MEALNQLLTELNFAFIEDTSAFADVDGCLVKLTVLSGEPLSLLMAFFVGTSQVETPLQLASIPAAEKIEVSFEDGFLWLSLIRLQPVTGAALVESVRLIVTQLKQAGLEFEARCGVCGAEGTAVTLQNSQPVRICASCLESQQRRTEELNRFSFSKMLFLPLAMLGVAIGWTALWVLMDFFVEWMNGDQDEMVLEINRFTSMLLLGIGLALFVMGTGMGSTMRFARSSRALAIGLSVVVGLGATMAGEVLYIWTTLFRKIGFISFEMAEKLLIPWLQSYDSTWLFIKFCAMCCAVGGCLVSTRETKTAPLMESDAKQPLRSA